ncbi:hypothetical protein CC78DRAFT_577848 [Lojkania enalia]|uniref:Uncharacterized protein n=1 Tax=Lojkania enalia TaxID=147567 RepID=A0A9P4N7N5_9PLEO|nr:hypothetical protein CC78DRAFT_577848 [Didymosphaeria enalia]
MEVEKAAAVVCKKFGVDPHYSALPLHAATGLLYEHLVFTSSLANIAQRPLSSCLALGLPRMSAESLPITPARFAAALESLPISSLHAKAAELQNSIVHLEKSNRELEEWARQGDKDCYEALMENKQVIRRMEERIELVKKEVTEVRGLPWAPPEQNKGNEAGTNGMAPVERNGDAQRNAANGQDQEQRNGPANTEENGVFL